MAEFETSLPSVRLIQTYIKDKPDIEIKLLSGELLTGKVLWQDPDCICLINEDKVKTMIWRQAIGYIHAKSNG
jgi:host factor-I protein